MLNYKEITIVIVSYKSKRKILNFLKNIKINCKIIIVENSSDQSIKNDLIKFSKNVDIFFTGNIGYGNSANYAREKLNTKYFFLLNPDLIGIDNKVIDFFLYQAKKMKDNFSCLGPRYTNIDQKTLKQSNKNFDIGYVKAISGAAMFFNTKNFDLIGGFDKNIFLYFEENDYCKRGRKLKLYSYQLNSVGIIHNMGTAVEYDSIVEKNQIKKLYSWHFIWSKYYFYNKHYGKILSLLYFLPIIVRSYIKIFFSLLTDNTSNEEKYKNRLEAIFKSMKGVKAYKRIN
jgi:GT2 family glycosyltransferase